jgi:hypothetical protein
MPLHYLLDLLEFYMATEHIYYRIMTAKLLMRIQFLLALITRALDRNILGCMT